MSPTSRGGFSVSWNAYSSSISGGLQDLQQRSEFVDMTIAADGHLVRVHQLVVGLASPYLRELIRSAPTPHPIIFLNNVSYSVLRCILEYIYTGEVVVPADDFKNFVVTSKALHIIGLEDMTFQEKVNPKNKQQKPASPDVVEAATTLENISTGQIPQSDGKNEMYATESRNIYMKPDNLAIKRQSSVAIDTPKPKLFKLSDYDNTETLEEISYSDEERLSEREELHDMTITHEIDPYDQKSSIEKSPTQDRDQPEITYTISNMGGIQLILNRYMYRMRNKYKDGRRRWQCVNYNLTKCTAMAVTHDNKVVSRASFHNHPFHDKKIMSKVKNGLVYTSIKSMPSTFNLPAD